MQMLVEMDYETSSNILKEVLVEDYKNIQRDIERLCQEEILAPHKQEDFKNFVEMSDALEIMMKYYFVASEANDIIEENSYDRHLSRENPSDKPLPINAYNDAERLYMGAEF
jgi:hypothetical protein